MAAEAAKKRRQRAARKDGKRQALAALPTGQEGETMEGLEALQHAPEPDHDDLQARAAWSGFSWHAAWQTCLPATSAF
jgi:hypothetical protein